MGSCSLTQGVPSLVLSDDLEGWDREGDGREVRERGDICILMADSR